MVISSNPGSRNDQYRNVVQTPFYDMVPKELGANARFRADLLRAAANDIGLQMELKMMCRMDPLFYINTFCWTHDPRLLKKGLNPKVPFITYDFQDKAIIDLLECILNGKDGGVEKSRDMGASWIILTCFEWLWHFYEDQSFGVVSRNEDYVDKRGDSKALMWKIDFIHLNQPRWLLPTGRWLGDKDPNRTSMHLRNADTNSTIDGESTTGDIFRGGRLTAMLGDEFAAFKIDDGYKALKASRDVTDCRIFNSTPNGANNAFYEVMHNTALKKIRMHWADHPEKNRGLYRSTKDGKIELLDDFEGMVEVIEKGQPDSEWVVFPSNYPFIPDGKLRSPWYDTQCNRCTTPQEVAQELDIDYAGSDYQFFDPGFINALRQRYARPPEMVGQIEYNIEDCSPKRFREDDKGRLKLWITLETDYTAARDRKFVVGVDVSAGTGASNSVITIADAMSGEKVGVLRDSRIDPKDFARLSIAVSKYFNNAFLIWDASGPTGKVFTTTVIENGYRYIYYRRNERRVGGNISDQPGYYLNPEAKESLLTEYRASLGEYKFINPSDEGLKECLQFVRRLNGYVEHSGSANSQDPGGARSAHGDEVIADALAALAIRDKGSLKSGSTPEVPIGSLAWRMKQRENARMALTQDTLGDGW